MSCSRWSRGPLLNPASPLMQAESRKARSAGRVSIKSERTCFSIASAQSMSSVRSAKAISGSTIQNSARCREVCEASARNVGPNVYTSPAALAAASAWSWPETVRNARFLKKSPPYSTCPVVSLRGGGDSLLRSVVTWNSSPAPSQSEVVMIGVCTCLNPRSWKKEWIEYASLLRTRRTARWVLERARRCGSVRRNSSGNRPLASGYCSGGVAPSRRTLEALISTAWPLPGLSTIVPTMRHDVCACAFASTCSHPGMPISATTCSP
mmetsp:Transcript_70593/g.169125  ORF Transcript_70593/g.169125 Transcript_70593/m.169125 type:complete len:266 (-) Transcript_70593:72-869(-)